MLIPYLWKFEHLQRLHLHSSETGMENLLNSTRLVSLKQILLSQVSTAGILIWRKWRFRGEHPQH